MDYFIEFNHGSILVQCPFKDVSEGIEELFKNLFQIGEKKGQLIASYKVYKNERFMGIMKDGQYVYTQKSDNNIEIVNALMNEVKLDFLEAIDDSLALHAALVSYSGKSILLPGNSGTGKSLTTLGLLSLGCEYHTDEVVLHNPRKNTITPFVRPLMIKPYGTEAAKELIGDQLNEFMILGDTIHSLPVEALNRHFGRHVQRKGLNNESILHSPPAISAIVFPQYDAESRGELVSLSPAQTMLELFKNNVIARNLPDLGMTSLKQLVQQANGVRLRYAGYNQLPDLFKEIQAML